MSKLNANTTVAEMVSARLSRARVFEKHGIDYCCGGKRPLTDICLDKNLNPEEIIKEIEANDALNTGTERDWTQASMTELCDDIEATHHAYLRREFTRIEPMIVTLMNKHRETHPELAEVLSEFRGLKEEILSHLTKEEQILFPMIRKLDSSDTLPSFHCGTVANPIRVMMLEHDSSGESLEKMRTLTSDYKPPADACSTYRVMLQGLEDLEVDMHHHIHKENHILFPRAEKREADLRNT
jgi:regulator of cell morphogenesis and NO signaling